MRINDLVVISDIENVNYGRVCYITQSNGSFHFARPCGCRNEESSWIDETAAIVLSEFQNNMIKLNDAIGYAHPDPIECINRISLIIDGLYEKIDEIKKSPF